MYVRRLMLILLILWISAPTNCAEPKPKEIIPLAVGNKWEYKVTPRSQTKKARKAFSVVIGKEDHADNTWFRYVDLVDDPKNVGETDSDFYVRSAKDGQRELQFAEDENGRNKEKIENEYLYFAYPVDNVPRTVKLTFAHVTVVATDEKVTVPAGTFKCYHYQTRGCDENGKIIDDKVDVEFWIAPGVGMVRWQASDPHQKDKVAELIAFELKEQ